MAADPMLFASVLLQGSRRGVCRLARRLYGDGSTRRRAKVHFIKPPLLEKAFQF